MVATTGSKTSPKSGPLDGMRSPKTSDGASCLEGGRACSRGACELARCPVRDPRSPESFRDALLQSLGIPFKRRDGALGRKLGLGHRAAPIKAKADGDHSQHAADDEGG